MAENDPDSRDELIKRNLENFLPYICDCVKATDLMTHLHYFSKEQRKEIFELSKRNSTDAMRRAMDVLLHVCDDQGRFAAIRDALQDSEYPKIVAMLDGESVSTDENCRKILCLFTREIKQRLNPLDLLPSLVRQGTITVEDAEEIIAEERNYGKMRGCWVLLFHLPNRVEHWFKDFMDVLIECDYMDISEMLDPDMHNKLMMQKHEHNELETNRNAILEHTARDDNFDIEQMKGDLDSPAMERECSKTVNFDVCNRSEKSFDKPCLNSLFNDETFHKPLIDNYSTDTANSETDMLKVDTTPRLDLRVQSPDDQQCDNSKSEINRSRFKKILPLNSEGNNRNIQYSTDCAYGFEQFVDNTENNACSGIDMMTSGFKLLSDDTRVKERADQDHNCREEYTEVAFNNDFDEAPSDTDTEYIDFGFLLSDDTGLKNSNEDAVQEIKHLDEASEPVEQDPESVPETHHSINAAQLDSIEMVENNLNIDHDKKVEGNKQDNTEWNIPTDADSIEADDLDISLREYQKELAKEGSEGENIVIMAPTNSGKTIVACKIIQVHLRRRKQSGLFGKVIFLVENEALAFQQGKVSGELLPAYRTKAITGSVQRDKKQFLRDFVERRDILVVTAQVLLNALKLGEIDSLTSFSLIVFDECHHTDNLHRYNEIMSKYMDLKLRDHRQASVLPQIIGLTASLGVGGTTNEDAAMKHMKGLLANLDAKFLCTVRKNCEDLKCFVNNPREEIVTAKKRVNDRFRQAILDIMEKIDKYMSSHHSMSDLKEKDKFIKIIYRVPGSRGTEQFLQWLSQFEDAIGRVSSKVACRMMDTCRIHLEAYNKALLVHADARIKEAEAFLDSFMCEEMEVERETETDAMLISLYRDLKAKNFLDEPENPKLLKMQELLVNDIGNDDNARGIIFVKRRELARALVKWMKETEPLKELNAVEFVGQVAAAAEGGMTKSEQKSVLDDFEDGKHKVIIATSVAEEGLDIMKCNLVIRYEHVTNEIVRLQSRGRARARNSRYYVLTAEGSWIVEKEEKNAMLEKFMHDQVPKLQAYIEDHPNLWEQELQSIQEEQKVADEMKAEQRKVNRTIKEVQFQCRNCSKFICMSSDIRKIQNVHHVVINKDVPKRLISFRDPHPKFMDEQMQFDGAIFCGNPDCQRELGGVCEYRHVEFPLLKIKCFKIVYENGESRTFKQWKKANLEIEPFSVDDLAEVVERRRIEM